MATPFLFFMVTRDGDGSYDLRLFKLSAPVQTELTKHFEGLRDSILGKEIKQIAYAPTYEPEKGEVLFIDNFVLPDLQKRAAETPQSFAVIKPPFTEKKIIAKAVMAVESSQTGNHSFYFQYFNQTHLIEPSRGIPLLWTKDQFVRLNESGISITDRLDGAIEKGILYFRSFSLARQFLKLDEYYAEASDEEIKKFLQHKRLEKVDVDRVLEHASEPVRKKFFLVMKSGILDNPAATPEQIQIAAKTFGIDVKTAGKAGHRKIVLPVDKEELTKTIRFLAEEYYLSIITHEPHIANSYRKVEE